MRERRSSQQARPIGRAHTCEFSPMRSAPSHPSTRSRIASGGNRRPSGLESRPCLSSSSSARSQTSGAFGPPARTRGAIAAGPASDTHRHSTSTATDVLRGQRAPRRIASCAERATASMHSASNSGRVRNDAGHIPPPADDGTHERTCNRCIPARRDAPGPPLASASPQLAARLCAAEGQCKARAAAALKAAWLLAESRMGAGRGSKSTQLAVLASPRWRIMKVIAASDASHASSHAASCSIGPNAESTRAIASEAEASAKGSLQSASPPCQPSGV
eukprot:scaffold9772_cov128-Isochrysis_galbana.AAC.6